MSVVNDPLHVRIRLTITSFSIRDKTRANVLKSTIKEQKSGTFEVTGNITPESPSPMIPSFDLATGLCRLIGTSAGRTHNQLCKISFNFRFWKSPCPFHSGTFGFLKMVLVHSGGRARNSDELNLFVYTRRLKKHIFQAIAKKQFSKCTHTFLV